MLLGHLSMADGAPKMIIEEEKDLGDGYVTIDKSLDY